MQAFNSRNEFFKLPFGAVSEDRTLSFKIALDRSDISPYLVIFRDGGESKRYSMAFTENKDGKNIFAVFISCEEYGLYYYYFDIGYDGLKIYNVGKGDGAIAASGAPFQLTVYKKNFDTPAKAKGKVFYQIFPDRFYESGEKESLHFADRVYRKNKKGEPYFYPTNTYDGFLNRDYFGGNLQGIIEKLPYLVGLGVDYIYLNPIFEAHANHRYNTADYMKIDPDLGTLQDFRELCHSARENGIGIILDGVFSHTGSDSIYFNKEGRYGESGAYKDVNSPYRSWFDFDQKYPCGYRAWWNFETLPEVNENEPRYIDYICGAGGVVDYWLSQGASGFRLDVADELPDSFIRLLRKRVKSHGQDKLLIGEVWEDATNKISFGTRREYLLGDGLDTVMNYPFRTAIIDFLRNGDGFLFCERVVTICENYPKEALDVAMNSLSTHDTPRAMTYLCGENPDSTDRYWQSNRYLSVENYEKAQLLISCGFALLFGLPGVPCIYYGDEIGMQGYRDPFNRGYFRWWSIDEHIQKNVQTFSSFRKDNDIFAEGRIHFVFASLNSVAFIRYEKCSAKKVIIGANRGKDTEEFEYEGQKYTLEPLGFLMLEI